MYDLSRRLYKYVEPRRALEILVNGLKPSIMEVDVRKSHGMVLAEDVYSPIDRPWTNLSHVDGFAVRVEDVRSASSVNPVKLKVVEGVDSRNAHNYRIGRGEAVYVETGYPIPEGADAVIPVESVRVEEGYVYVYANVGKGYNVTPRGGDVSRGEIIARRGTVVTPALQKLLIDLGIPSVKVYRKPVIMVYGVGDELVEDVVPPSTTMIPNSSAYMVKGVLEYYGGVVEKTSILPDNPGVIAETISQDLEEADIVVTIGGVSMGPKDYTWTTLVEKLGATSYFRGLRVQPGRATSGLRVRDKVIVNLPGLPQSTLTGLVFILIPLVNYLRGIGAYIKLPYTKAKNKETTRIEKYPGFQRVRYVELSNGYAKILSDIDSYYVKPIALADGFTIIPPGKTLVKEGEEVKVYHLPPLHNIRIADKLP